MIKKLLLAALLLASGAANAQLYSKFGPVTGVLKGNVSTPQTSAAASSDITGLFSCVADTSHFLNGAGTCTTPTGTGVTSVGLTAPSWYTVTGSPVTSSGTLAITAATGQAANRVIASPDGTTGAVSLRALVAGDIPPINLGSTANGGVSSATILLGTNGGTSNGFFSVTGPTTALRTFTFPNASATVLTTNAAVTVAQGGTGVATLTNHGVLLGQGASNVAAVTAMAADTLLQGQGASADPAAVSVNNCGSSTTALSYSTSTHTFGCQTISAGGTGTVTSLTSGTAIVLSPSTITTTGSIALDTTASPTITGTWTYSTAPVFNAGWSGSDNANLAVEARLSNPNTGVNAVSQAVQSDAGTVATFTGITGVNNVTPKWTNGPTAQHAFLGNQGNVPLSIATNSIERIRIAAAGNVTMNVPASGITQTVNGLNNNRTVLITGGATTGQSFGLEIDAGTNSSDQPLQIFARNGTTNLLALTGAGVLSAVANYSSAGAVSTTAGGVFTTASDLRLKDVVGPATAGLNEILKLKPIRYRWNQMSGLDDPKHTIYSGFGAQDVLPYIPDAVGQNPYTGYYSLSDRPIVAALVLAVQEQQREIDKLKAEKIGR
jgi:hypothetical protein